MPRVEIPVAAVVRAGTLADSFIDSDAVNMHYIAVNAGDVELEVVNESGTVQTIVVEANPDVFNDGLTLGDLTLDVPSGATAGNPAHFGAFRPNTFKQDTDGMMHLNPSVSTTLKIRAFQRETARNSTSG